MSADFDLINAALTRTGNDPITAYEDGTAQANIARANYEVVVKAELSANRWKFAGKFEALDLLVDTPPEPWLYAFQLPTDDLILLRNVTQSGVNVDFAVEHTKIYANVTNDQTEVIAHYLWRPDETAWPPSFAEAVTKRMEAIFLRALGERHDEAAERDKEADKAFAAARRIDAQSQTPRDPWTYPILAARRA